MKKYQYKSRAEAEQAYQKASSEATISSICLNAVLNGEVTWLEEGNYRAGLIRPDSATGGYVIVQYRCEGQKDHAVSYYVDDWTTNIMKYGVINTRIQEDKDIYTLAQRVKIARDKLAK